MNRTKISLTLLSIITLSALKLGTPVFAQSTPHSLPHPTSIPGDRFYPFERFLENIRLFFTIGTDNKAKYRLDLASERLAEANTLLAAQIAQALATLPQNDSLDSIDLSAIDANTGDNSSLSNLDLGNISNVNDDIIITDNNSLTTIDPGDLDTVDDTFLIDQPLSDIKPVGWRHQALNASTTTITDNPPPTTDQMRSQIQRMASALRSSLQRATNLRQQARNSRDVIRLNCVNDKLTQIKGLSRIFQSARSAWLEAVQVNKPEDIAHNYNQMLVAYQNVQRLRQEAETCLGEELIFLGPTEVQLDVWEASPSALNLEIITEKESTPPQPSPDNSSDASYTDDPAVSNQKLKRQQQIIDTLNDYQSTIDDLIKSSPNQSNSLLLSTLKTLTDQTKVVETFPNYLPPSSQPTAKGALTTVITAQQAYKQNIDTKGSQLDVFEASRLLKNQKLDSLSSKVAQQNGLCLNGFSANGLCMNGLTFNGLTQNGLTFNGLNYNGLTFNGICHNGLAFNGLTFNGISYNGSCQPIPTNQPTPTPELQKDQIDFNKIDWSELGWETTNPSPLSNENSQSSETSNPPPSNLNFAGLIFGQQDLAPKQSNNLAVFGLQTTQNNGIATTPQTGTLNAPFNGQVNASLNATLNSQLNAALNGILNATFNGNINGLLNNIPRNGHFNGTLNGSFNGTLNGTLNGTFNGTTNGTINGSFNGTINGLLPKNACQLIDGTGSCFDLEKTQSPIVFDEAPNTPSTFNGNAFNITVTDESNEKVIPISGDHWVHNKANFSFRTDGSKIDTSVLPPSSRFPDTPNPAPELSLINNLIDQISTRQNATISIGGNRIINGDTINYIGAVKYDNGSVCNIRISKIAGKIQNNQLTLTGTPKLICHQGHINPAPPEELTNAFDDYQKQAVSFGNLAGTIAATNEQQAQELAQELADDLRRTTAAATLSNVSPELIKKTTNTVQNVSKNTLKIFAAANKQQAQQVAQKATDQLHSLILNMAEESATDEQLNFAIESFSEGSRALLGELAQDEQSPQDAQIFLKKINSDLNKITNSISKKPNRNSSTTFLTNSQKTFDQIEKDLSKGIRPQPVDFQIQDSLPLPTTKIPTPKPIPTIKPKPIPTAPPIPKNSTIPTIKPTSTAPNLYTPPQPEPTPPPQPPPQTAPPPPEESDPPPLPEEPPPEEFAPPPDEPPPSEPPILGAIIETDLPSWKSQLIWSYHIFSFFLGMP